MLKFQSNRKRGGKGRRQRDRAGAIKVPTKVGNARPFSVRATLHSCGELTLNEFEAGNEGFLLYSNSAYDPTGTFTSASPRFFDEWASLYGNYAVVKTRYKITCINSNPASTNNLCYYFVHPTNSSTDHKALDSQDLVTFPETKWGASRLIVGTDCLVLSGVVDNLKWAHIKDYQDNDNFTAAVTTNPAFLVYLEFIVRNTTDDASKGKAFVEMWQDTIFFAPRDVAA